MEVTEVLKNLLKAHEMASVADFIDEEHVEDYLENTDLGLAEIGILCETYSGYGLHSIEHKIINELKEIIIWK